LDTDNEQGNAAGSDLQSEDDPCLIHRRRVGDGGAGGDVSTVLWWRISVTGQTYQRIIGGIRFARRGDGVTRSSWDEGLYLFS